MNKLDLFLPLVPEICRASGQPEKEVQRIVAEMMLSELLATYSFQTKNGKVAPFLSQEQIDALQKLAAIEKSGDDALLAQAEAAAHRTVFALKQYEQDEPKRAAQLEADRKTFADAARTLNFGVTESSFNVTRSLLGPGFSAWQIEQALSSNALILPEPSCEETTQWEAERIAQHNHFLKTCDVETLKRLTREAGRRAHLQVRPLDETQRVRAAEQQMHGPVYEPLLPTSRFKGQLITKDLLWRVSKEDVRFIVMKFGEAQLKERILNGVPAAQ